LIDELDSIASWDLMFEGDGDSNQKKALEENNISKNKQVV
jgi:hypothetical protein